MSPGRFTASRVLPEVIEVPGLASGRTVHLSHTARSSRPRFTLRVEIDPDNRVAEANERNNAFVDQIDQQDPAVGRWLSIGPRRIFGGGPDAVGRLRAIAVHPIDPSLIYVGAASTMGFRGQEGGSGIWRTVAGGAAWEPIADTLPTLAIAALAIDPTDLARLYAVTIEGLFRSEDAGTSWIEVGGSSYPPVRRGREVFLIDPRDPNRLYLTAMGGLFRSLDRGESWQNLDVTPGATPGDLVMDPGNPDRLYTAMRLRGDAQVTGIYRSDDGGDSWRQLVGCPGGELPQADGFDPPGGLG